MSICLHVAPPLTFFCLFVLERAVWQYFNQLTTPGKAAKPVMMKSVWEQQ